jgi:hypothetical protein
MVAAFNWVLAGFNTLAGQKFCMIAPNWIPRAATRAIAERQGKSGFDVVGRLAAPLSAPADHASGACSVHRR